MTHLEKRIRGYEAAEKVIGRAIERTREYVNAAEADKHPTLAILKARLSSLIFAKTMLALGAFPDEAGNRQQIVKALGKTDAQ